MAIPPSLRFAVLERDSFRCVYCGASVVTGGPAQIDHVTPQALGGGDSYRNLVTACRECNAGKGAEPPSLDLLAHVHRHIRAAAVRRSLELLRVLPEVVARYPGEDLEFLAAALPDPHWPRDAGWAKDLASRVNPDLALPVEE